ncbi:unnamed protein product [Taenia asiatica]|uniref:Aa_trans domain-containing protein n=1 Tax=Taenia asiatica TaxID=60517 RepID=A0A0R3VY55_TAEAS|nr:unnamed protein product [Taenia asiatica]
MARAFARSVAISAACIMFSPVNSRQSLSGQRSRQIYAPICIQTKAGVVVVVVVIVVASGVMEGAITTLFITIVYKVMVMVMAPELVAVRCPLPSWQFTLPVLLLSLGLSYDLCLPLDASRKEGFYGLEALDSAKLP